SLISYGGKVTVNVVSCRAIMPDPATYCDYIRETYEELRTAVAAMEQPTPKKTRRKTTRRASGKAAKASPAQAS
ncbi:MAG TPA: WS/DGAT domain-containing protein, partial [Woeseiaceae bacterium]